MSFNFDFNKIEVTCTAQQRRVERAGQVCPEPHSRVLLTRYSGKRSHRAPVTQGATAAKYREAVPPSGEGVVRRRCSLLKMSARGKYATLAGMLSIIGVMGMLPMWIKSKIAEPLSSADKELTGSQIQRGQFMNTGSKDVGRDPDWDAKHAVYKPNHPGAYPPEERKRP